MLSRRFFSSSARQLKAQVSKLPNGITIASQPSTASTSTIGLYLNSGSRSENPYNSGVSTLTGAVLAGSKAAKQFFASGVEFSSSNAKESSGLIKATFATGNTSAAVSSIKSLFSQVDSVVSDEAYVKSKANEASYYSGLFETVPSQMVVEHTVATAFQGTSLALPTYGKADTLSTLESADIKNFLKKQLVSSNAAIVATGVEHDVLVKLASELSLPTGAKPATEPAHFIGSEARLRDDTMPKSYVSIAVKTPSIFTDDYITGLVAAQINGGSEHSNPFFSYQGSQLAQFLGENHLIDNFNHYQFGFSDIGLWGAYLETSNIECLDETVHFTLKDWNRYSSGTLTDGELSRAKQQLKLKLFTPNASSSAATDSLAAEALIKGYTQSEAELSKAIDAVSLSTLKKWAFTYLYDQDIAMAGTGQIEALFDYNRIRNDMSMMRW